MKTVTTLPLEQVEVGMVVAAAVLDAGGHVLVPAGTGVSESLLAALQRREIAELAVEFEQAEDPSAREARRLKLLEELDRRFRLAGDSPEIREIYQAVLDFRLENA